MVNADAIAEMASVDLIHNLHLDNDNPGIQGCIFNMYGGDVADVDDVCATTGASNATLDDLMI
jgi:hypothetical protein